MKSLHRFFCSFVQLSSLFISCVAAGDTITINHPLHDKETIISSRGTFVLGFFTPDNNSNRRYLGIWYNKVTKFTVVWIANRDAPLNDTNGLLKITQQAKLALFSNETKIIWSTNSSSDNFTNNPIAQLFDSGNLVVKDAADDNSNPGNFLWQSFDYPTDTILPGAKLGVDLVKAIDRYAQSPRSRTDPSRGDFIFRMDTHGFPQQFVFNGSTALYCSGPWNGLRFSGIQALKPNNVYKFEFVYTPEEVYYKYDLINSSVYSKLTLSPDGIFQRLDWNYRTQDWFVYLQLPPDNCHHYGQCQGYGICNIDNSPICRCLDKFVPKFPNDWLATDWSGGCIRRVPLDCQKGDGFLKYSKVKLPDTRWSWYDQSLTLKECERKCLENCSCMAYSNIDVTGKGSGCLLWFDHLIDMIELTDTGQDIYIRMASSEIGW